jgi:hypothetical protein
MTSSRGHASELSRPIYAVPDAPPETPEAFAELPEVMWELPARIADATLRDLHASLVRGMRRDAAHLPTGTLQAMQLERICSIYIHIRYNESTGRWRSESDRRAMYKLWRDLTSDFNATVYNGKISPEDLHNIIQSHTAKIIAAVLSSLPSEQARPLYPVFATALDNAGEELGA